MPLRRFAVSREVLSADRHGLLSDEHFRVDGTLIEAAASLKSLKPREGEPPPGPDEPLPVVSRPVSNAGLRRRMSPRRSLSLQGRPKVRR